MVLRPFEVHKAARDERQQCGGRHKAHHPAVPTVRPMVSGPAPAAAPGGGRQARRGLLLRRARHLLQSLPVAAGANSAARDARGGTAPETRRKRNFMEISLKRLRFGWFLSSC